MKLPKKNIPVGKKKAASELAEGFQYLKNTPSISMIILLLAIISFLVFPYDTLLPIFAKEFLKAMQLLLVISVVSWD